tara:strand:+ start:2745 stop:3845 length:1101 start_codon:yes stop_codon:yes gene_type:complete
MNTNLYSLGLMSGTSLDGVDVSIIKSDGEQYLEIIDNLYLKYDIQLKSKLKKIVNLCKTKNQLIKATKEIKEVEKELTLYHVNAYKLITKKNKKIKINLIGFHGQTILHKPKKGYTIQIGDSKLLSKMTNITVVSNFRENDILNGGQGAPLTPIYHQLILSKIKSKLPLALINIGGISNITYIKNDNELVGFDTGPGNYLIDRWVKTKTKKEFDNNGLIAKSGQTNSKILKKLLKNPYYKKKFPKSLDVKEFNLKILSRLSLEDGCATLSMLTAKSICMALNSFKKKPNLVLISGGGRKNKYIINCIKKNFYGPVKLTDDFNFNGDFIESQAFAYLAIRSYSKKFITYPSITGVRKPCTGGIIFKN